MAEVQDVFLASFDEYRKSHFVPLQAQKAAKAIMECRTQALGGHADVCTDCGYSHQSYNSCRNRHCPKCQTVKKEQWIGKRKQDVLDVKHFHTVFTIPAQLNALVLQNPRKLYELLFRASGETVKELTADAKYLGAEVGFMSILHSWGSNMSFHPHIHMVVTAGGIAPDDRWKPSRGRFFLPVRVLSSLFRGKILSGCKSLYAKGELSLKGENGNTVSRNAFSSLIDACYKKDWVVSSKQPFNGAEGVFEYLGRYTHRLVISNNRILSVENGMTSFLWKDYRDEARLKQAVLTNDEFIRRFLLHVLPHGFTRIRHYGLYSSRNKSSRLELYRMVLAARYRHKQSKKKDKKLETPLDIVVRILGRDPRFCPKCGSLLNQQALARASPA
ncbi:MAG: IS91 family transposase [Spirochaetia bacterium]|nr:IS91 family transposase [Spirochaetia bacterium]